MESGAVRAQSSAGTPTARTPAEAPQRECAGCLGRFSDRMDSERLGIRARLTRVAVCALCAGTLLAGAPSRAIAASAPANPDAAPAQGFRASPRQQAFLDQLQADTFKFFWEASPPGTGLTPDRAPGPH